MKLLKLGLNILVGILVLSEAKVSDPHHESFVEFGFDNPAPRQLPRGFCRLTDRDILVRLKKKADIRILLLGSSSFSSFRRPVIKQSYNGTTKFQLSNHIFVYMNSINGLSLAYPRAPRGWNAVSIAVFITENFEQGCICQRLLTQSNTHRNRVWTMYERR